MKYTVVIVALMLWATSASAQSYPSTAWVEECSKSEKVIGDNIHTCRAYIHGLINALAIWQVSARKQRWCVFHQVQTSAKFANRFCRK
jgi:hypothetical protein